MRPTLFPMALVFACHGDTKGDGVDTGGSEPAIDEASSPDRVGTYAHRLPDSPSTVIFLGDSITAGSGAGDADKGYASLLVNNADAWPD